MKTIIKLTNEYASNLNALFFNVDGSFATYYEMFHYIFNQLHAFENMDFTDESLLRDIDIVFIKVDNDFKFQSHQQMKRFIQSLRIEKELLPVYLIKDNIKNIDVVEMLDACYCLDGLLPTPFDRNRVYRFLYRVLKRITVEKELHAYIATLEEELYSPLEREIYTQNTVSKVEKLDKERQKDIRFSQLDKISASEFMASLDDTIIDKVENLALEIDALIGILYEMNALDASKTVALIPRANAIIDDIFILIDSIGVFPIAARAFKSLNLFLSNLSVESLKEKEKKDLIIAMLLAIISDLEKWIDVVFLHHTTDDIHYLDASFASNVMELENLFEESDDDEDLEFF